MGLAQAARIEALTGKYAMDKVPTSIVIFTDGACTGNPGPGGWGSIVAWPSGTVKELGGGNKETTNNRMEMVAAIRALAALEEPSTLNIILYTDSTYLIKGITQWIWGWRNKGWKNAEGKDVANRELWEELLRQVTRLKPATVDWKYVRGHAGYPGNERCDQIAVSFSKNNPEQLYVGDRDGYFVDLENLPSQEDIPENKFSNKNSAPGAARSGAASKGSYGSSAGGHKSSSSSSGPATYLSYYGGVVNRHTTWVDCEKHVKGRNAKFKKAKSRDEEREILRSWGLDPQTAIQ